MLQNVSRARRRKYIKIVLKPPRWIPVSLHIEFIIIWLVLKALCSVAPLCLPCLQCSNQHSPLGRLEQVCWLFQSAGQKPLGRSFLAFIMPWPLEQCGEGLKNCWKWSTMSTWFLIECAKDIAHFIFIYFFHSIQVCLFIFFSFASCIILMSLQF